MLPRSWVTTMPRRMISSAVRQRLPTLQPEPSPPAFRRNAETNGSRRSLQRVFPGVAVGLADAWVPVLAEVDLFAAVWASLVAAFCAAKIPAEHTIPRMNFHVFINALTPVPI